MVRLKDFHSKTPAKEKSCFCLSGIIRDSVCEIKIEDRKYYPVADVFRRAQT